jgi:hypothetical protein
MTQRSKSPGDRSATPQIQEVSSTAAALSKNDFVAAVRSVLAADLVLSKVVFCCSPCLCYDRAGLIQFFLFGISIAEQAPLYGDRVAFCGRPQLDLHSSSFSCRGELPAHCFLTVLASFRAMSSCRGGFPPVYSLALPK